MCPLWPVVYIQTHPPNNEVEPLLPKTKNREDYEETTGMFSSGRGKHLLHCTAFILFIVWLITFLLPVADAESTKMDPWVRYGTFGSLFLYTLRILVLLALPQVLLNMVGLLCFNAFPEPVTLKGSPILTPLICFRTVTRGDFPQLVQENVSKNLSNCSEAGIENFLVEVVSDKPINLALRSRTREIVVPPSYKPRGGALYKARALQYCLEEDVNVLSDDDYVVHLDEETIMTSDAIRGILNFVLEKKYEFGQGLITYANGQVVNWFTTLADSIRVADDMGKLRAQFHMFHKPVLSWKGSFIVSKVGAERDVSFDHGIKGSIAEDCHFAMRACMKDYRFGFVEGEMHEKSPFSVWDFIQQRKRWVQGISMVVKDGEIPWRCKILLACSLYAWITMPFTLSNLVLGFVFPLPVPNWLNVLALLISAVNIYMYVFGVIKSVSVYRLGLFRYGLCLISLVFVILLSAILESVAIFMAVLGDKRKFYVVNKDWTADGNTQNV